MDEAQLIFSINPLKVSVIHTHLTTHIQIILVDLASIFLLSDRLFWRREMVEYRLYEIITEYKIPV